MPIVYETAFTVENLNLLEQAIVQGVTSVKYSDKEITYRSLDEMLRLAALIRKSLGLGPNPKNGFFGGGKKIGRHTKGLC